MNGRPFALCRGRGFTLLEFLIALTILALMLGVTMNSLNFSVRTSNSVEGAILATEELHLAQRALRRQIQRAVPRLRATESGPDHLDFAGTAKVLEFVAPLHGVSAAAGLYRIRFEIEDGAGFGDGGGRLVMYYARSAAAPTPDWRDAGGAVLVLDGFAAAEFDYSSAAAQAGVEWSGDWRDPSRLPSLVRLHLEYPSGSDRVAPDMVVSIRSTSRSRMLSRAAGS